MYLFVLKLFQPRQTINRRIVAPILRRLIERYKLNTTLGKHEQFFNEVIRWQR